MSNEMKAATLALHWLTVGYVSEGAKKWIEDAGGKVLHLSSEPLLIAVAIAHNPAGAWVWSHGRREHRQGVEYWSLGELQEASTGITLRYGNSREPRTLAEYCSADSNYLILPDEEFDPATSNIKEPSMYDQSVEPEPVLVSELGDLDDHSF